MKAWTVLLALVGVFVGGMGIAGAVPLSADGNALLSSCRAALHASDNPREDLPTDLSDLYYCIGIVTGVGQTLVLVKSEYKTCFPEHGIANGQAARIVVKYLENHPQHLHLPAGALTFVAFEAAYPCK